MQHSLLNLSHAEHGISSGLFKVSCLQNLLQPAVPLQTQQTGGSMVRLKTQVQRLAARNYGQLTAGDVL